MHQFTQENPTTNPTVTQMAANIEAVLLEATAAEFTFGHDWYQIAHDWCHEAAERTGASLEGIATATAVLSPQCPWETNKQNVLKVAEEGSEVKIFASRKAKAEAWLAMFDGLRIPSNRPKTHAFADCLARPLESTHCVIDRHAIKVAWGVLGKKAITITTKRYLEAEEAYNIVANKFGLKAHQVQAITWVTYKRIVNR
jgi:hypothetical protein